MQYDLLTQDEIDDYILRGMHGRQLEHFQHSVNEQTYAEMLPLLPTTTDEEVAWKEHVTKLHREAGIEKAKIEALHDALAVQLEPARKASAMSRFEVKRTARLTQEAAALGISEPSTS